MLDTCDWMLLREYGNNIDTIISNMSIQVGNEQLIPEWGISVDIEYYQYVQEGSGPRPDFLEASIEFSDSSKQWLTGIPDGEGEQEQNWIRSGNRNDPQQP